MNYVELARRSEAFRRTIATGEHSQVVVMAIQPGEEIGEETHEGDQILLFVEGEGTAVLDGQSEPVRAGDLVFVPAGTLHNFVNAGPEALRLVTIYAPAVPQVGSVPAATAARAPER